MIQNITSNPGPFYVEIIDDDGSTIYLSDLVKPGYKIESDILSKEILRGRHDCKAVFHVLKGDNVTSEELGSVSVDLVLVQK